MSVFEHLFYKHFFFLLYSNSDLQVVDELNKVIKNLDGLRMICKLIAPTSLPEEKDITKLIYQAQKLCRILGVFNLHVLFTSSIIYYAIVFL